MGKGKSSFDAWTEFLSTVPFENRREEFLRDQYWIDTLPLPLTMSLKDAIRAAPPIEDWSAPYTLPALLDEPTLAKVMQEHQIRALDQPTIDAYLPVIQWLKWRVAEVLGAPWSILNVRSWTTKNGATEMGPNKWHRDGMPKEMFKLMIYLTQIGSNAGGIEFGINDEIIRQVHGPAGTWVLFYNSVLKHRGLAPTAEGVERVASEITLVASRQFDLVPVSLGRNARHALAPPKD